MSVNKQMEQMSMDWKKRSYDNLMSAKTEAEFAQAVLQCGREGHATRSLGKEYQPEYLTWLYGQRDNIKAGKLDIFNIPEFGGKRPISWTSKICHILNPVDYPLIWDSRVRSSLGANKRNWKELVKKHTNKDSDRIALYEAESRIWAK